MIMNANEMKFKNSFNIHLYRIDLHVQFMFLNFYNENIINKRYDIERYQLLFFFVN